MSHLSSFTILAVRLVWLHGLLHNEEIYHENHRHEVYPPSHIFLQSSIGASRLQSPTGKRCLAICINLLCCFGNPHLGRSSRVMASILQLFEVLACLRLCRTYYNCIASYSSKESKCFLNRETRTEGGGGPLSSTNFMPRHPEKSILFYPIFRLTAKTSRSRPTTRPWRLSCRPRNPLRWKCCDGRNRPETDLSSNRIRNRTTTAAACPRGRNTLQTPSPFRLKSP